MTSTPLPHDHGQPPEPTLAAMPDTESFQTIAELLKQLGDSSRIRIFWLLCHCEECVINLSAMMKMSSPAISHHLKQLKSSGLIVSRRSGKERARTERPGPAHAPSPRPERPEQHGARPPAAPRPQAAGCPQL